MSAARKGTLPLGSSAPHDWIYRSDNMSDKIPSTLSVIQVPDELPCVQTPSPDESQADKQQGSDSLILQTTIDTRL